MNARDLAILDLLHHGYHPPAPNHPDHERLMHLWKARYLARRDAAQRLIAAVAAAETEESTMATLSVTCHRCGVAYGPGPEAFPRGTWRTCPTCRIDPHPPAAGDMKANFGGAAARPPRGKPRPASEDAA
jgi:hypothetical protein